MLFLFFFVKILFNSGSKIMSIMLLSYFENCFNSIYLSMFNVLFISEFIFRGNRSFWRFVLGGFSLFYIFFILLI